MSHIIAVALRGAQERAPQGDGILSNQKGPGKTGAFDFW
jgi:hypothetical protein